jgi:hypothetical protein
VADPRINGCLRSRICNVPINRQRQPAETPAVIGLLLAGLAAIGRNPSFACDVNLFTAPAAFFGAGTTLWNWHGGGSFRKFTRNLRLNRVSGIRSGSEPK